MNTPAILSITAAALLAPLPTDGPPPRTSTWTLEGDAVVGSRAVPDGGVAGQPGPRECPPGVTYGQRPFQPDEPWIFDTSDTEPVRALYEAWPHDGSDVTNIWFWGADVNVSAFMECNEPNPLFNVSFHPDNGAGEPDLGVTLCSYQSLPAREKVFKDAYPLPGTPLVIETFQYKLNFDPVCPLPIGPHWVKVQGTGGEGRCWFLWLTSPQGDGVYFTVEPPPDPAHLTDGDLSLCINRPVVQEPNCPADTDGNKFVDVDDLVRVILNWGPCPAPCPPFCAGDTDGNCVVDVDDLVAIILAWGPCPGPPNDECADKIDIDRLTPDGVISVPFDMRGATPSPEPSQCIAGAQFKDAWWCLRNLSDQPKTVTIRTTIDLLLEVTDGCTCPPGPLVACGPGLFGGVTFPMAPGQGVCLRLINDQELPNEQLKGVIEILNEPETPPVNFYFDPAQFFEAIAAAGKSEKFFWDFKPDLLPPGAVVPIQPPLSILTHPFSAPNVWSDATGLDLWPPDVDNVTFTVNPAIPGALGLAYAKAPAFGLDNNALFAEEPPLSLDIISGPPAGDNHTAFLLELVALGGAGLPTSVLEVTVYDKNGNVLGAQLVTLEVPTKRFLGVLSKDPALTIGRINIRDLDGGFEGISAIGAYAQIGQPADGACCLPDGTCVVTTQVDCETALAGIYQGDFTTCLGVECPDATGACCLPDGTCIQATALECEEVGGLYLGDNIPCGTVECPDPVGACCLPDGTCIVTTQIVCKAVFAGVYQGDGVPCTAVVCPEPKGACCLPDGSCIFTTGADCQLQGGVFQGIGVPCTATTCPPPTGACCLTDGTCILATQADCESAAVGGVYQGDGTTCDTIDCPDPVNFYFDPAQFFEAIAAAEKTEKLFWNFKPDFLQPDTVVSIVDPLDINTHPTNAPGVWSDATGLDLWPPDVDNVTFASNPAVPGAAGLGYAKGPAFGLDNNALFAQEPTLSFDIISGPPAGDNHTAFAIDFVALGGAGMTGAAVQVTVYDKDDEVIGTIIISAEVGTKRFLGIITKDPALTIGRINIVDLQGGLEGISSIAAFAQIGPPFLGACCLPDGTCLQTTAADCAAIGGSYQGDFVPCSATQCPLDAHDLEPCPPGGCPEPGEPAWCVYVIEDVIGDPAECGDLGIKSGAQICVAPCPFPGDPKPCQPNAPDPLVTFRVVGTNCVFVARSIDRCQECPAGATAWNRIN